ncbi:MAG: flagellar biosynthesis protein FlhA [Candidatus Brocadiia bacterium]
MRRLNGTTNFVARHSDIVLAIGVMGILIAIIIPLPTPILDVLLTCNFAYVLLLLTVVLSVQNPLELSTFPSLLLIGTLSRLALNVASTRLILLNAYAGEVIESFGQFVVGGEVVVGLIIFIIIVVIQYIVITKGAERISEVGARFTLDAMPGKQMSIDADLSAGLINEVEAKQRREQIVQEADFYGAMDGASKYVRGDAIAGIVIVCINIIGGIVIGLTRGMSVGQAIKTYSILTVGDGLVSQIPAVIMSTAAGIIITKSASDMGLSKELGLQVFARERAVGIASCTMFMFMLFPGLPTMPFLVLGLALLGVYLALRGQRAADAEPGREAEAEEPSEPSEEELIRSLLEPDRIAVEVGYNLIQLIDPERGGTLLERIKSLRKKFARELGIVVPKIRILDNVELDSNHYVIKLSGHKVDEGEVHPGWLMAMLPDGEPDMNGISTTEPSFGLPVVWIARSEKERAQGKGYTVVDAETVFITHLSEVIRRHAHEVLSRQDVQHLLDNVKKENPAIVEELVPDVLSLGQVQQVLENLLAEGIPVTNLSRILEKLGNYAPQVKDLTLLTELVRKSLSRAICAKFCDEEGRINALSLDPHLEEELRDALEKADGEVRLNLPPARLRQIIAGISEQTRAAFRVGSDTVILTDSQIRPYVHSIVSRVFPDVAVLSYDEISQETEVHNVGVVTPLSGQGAPVGAAVGPETTEGGTGAE